MKATPSNKKCSVHKQIPSKLRGARTSQPVRNDSPTEKPLEPFIWATFEFACESGIPTPTNHGPFLKASFVWGSNEWTLGTAVTNAPCLPLPSAAVTMFGTGTSIHTKSYITILAREPRKPLENDKIHLRKARQSTTMCFSHVQMKPGFANKSAVSAFILAPSACVLRPKLAGGTSPHMWMMSR